MAARNFLPRSIAYEKQIFNDSKGIRLKSAVHLGKKFLAAIFSAIVYSSIWGSTSTQRPHLRPTASLWLPHNLWITTLIYEFRRPDLTRLDPELYDFCPRCDSIGQPAAILASSNNNLQIWEKKEEIEKS